MVQNAVIHARGLGLSAEASESCAAQVLELETKVR